MLPCAARPAVYVCQTQDVADRKPGSDDAARVSKAQSESEGSASSICGKLLPKYRKRGMFIAHETYTAVLAFHAQSEGDQAVIRLLLSQAVAISIEEHFGGGFVGLLARIYTAKRVWQ